MPLDSRIGCGHDQHTRSASCAVRGPFRVGAGALGRAVVFQRCCRSGTPRSPDATWSIARRADNRAVVRRRSGATRSRAGRPPATFPALTSRRVSGPANLPRRRPQAALASPNALTDRRNRGPQNRMKAVGAALGTGVCASTRATDGPSPEPDCHRVSGVTQRAMSVGRPSHGSLRGTWPG
jgi:hypothetical protein